MKPYRPKIQGPFMFDINRLTLEYLWFKNDQLDFLCKICGNWTKKYDLRKEKYKWPPIDFNHTIFTGDQIM